MEIALVVVQLVIGACELRPIAAQRVFGRSQIGQIAVCLGRIALRHILPQLREVFLHGTLGLIQLLPVLLHVLSVGGNVLAIMMRTVS